MANFLERLGNAGLAFQGQNQALQERKRTLSRNRRQAMALDFRDIANFVRSGDIDPAVTKANNRLSEISRLGGDPASTQFVKTLLEQGQTDEALRFIENIDKRFVNEGLLNPRTAELPEILRASEVSGTGQVRTRSATGELGSEQIPGFKPDPSDIARSQVSGTIQVKDAQGNLFNSASVFNPNTNKIEVVLSPIGSGPETSVGPVSLVDASGLTAKERVKQKGLEASTARAATAAIDASKTAFDKLAGIDSSIATLDEAVALIDQGAVDTGPILARLPTFRQAAVELENIQARLGLNVIQNTTFGALSQEELRFALSAALPAKLNPVELKAWILRKQSAQRMLSEHIKKAALFLGIPGNTIPKWLQFQKQSEVLKALDADVPNEIAVSSRTNFDAQGAVIK